MNSRKRAPLPPPCKRCLLGGGLWVLNDNRTGVERCSCPRGRALEQGAAFGKNRPARFDGRMEAANDGS